MARETSENQASGRVYPPRLSALLLKIAGGLLSCCHLYLLGNAPSLLGCVGNEDQRALAPLDSVAFQLPPCTFSRNPL